MLGLMQDWPLRVSAIIDHAARYHGGRRLVSRPVTGGIVETDWARVRRNALRVAQALRRLGMQPGDVVGAMAWNTHRHIEVWYGAPGAGCVLHSINPRLSEEQLAYIIDHAEDAWIFADPDIVPKLDAIAGQLPRMKGVIALCAADAMPESAFPLLCYDDLIGQEDGDADWHRGAEREACGLCYTSGTTGNPKGVLYEHRTQVLHAMAMIQPDMLGLSCRDVVMPAVPIFHANGWSTAFSVPMAGAGMVLPGRALDPASVVEMLGEGVTMAAAVPTVWLPLLAHLRETGGTLPDLERVVIGGSACPAAVIEAFQRDYGVRVLHAWGMTEISPLGSFASFKPEVAALPEAERMSYQRTVGHPPFTVDLTIRDDDGAALPWDGATQGRLQVRGAGVLRRYFKAEEDAIDAEGWFDTGDAATIDPLGYVRITDRFKDVIKSGGEWISSIDMENAAVAHPDVAEAAAVGMPHPKWHERPVLVVRPMPGRQPDREAIRALLAPHFANWQLPEDILFVESIPHTATGKISKRYLRERLATEGYLLPDLRPDTVVDG